MNILCDEAMGSKSGVHPQNRFVFPSTQGSQDHDSGYHCTKSVVTAAGVTKIKITATAMRHRDSTLFAQFETADEQRSFFYSHMGHSAEINKSVYQCPAGV